MKKEGDGEMKKRPGSYTLEAVIVMTSVIFVIFAIISAFLLLYQNAVMYAVATQAAQEGAIMWTDNAHTMEGGYSGEDTQGHYYRLGELFSGNKSKCKIIQSWAEKKLGEMTPNTLIGSGKETVNVTFQNYVVRRVIEVEITKEIDIPFKEIAQYFGQDLDMRVVVRASCSESAEYIRNIDYGLELAGDIWDSISGIFGSLLKSKS